MSHHLEADLEAIADVHDARVGLFGRYPTIEMRAVLAVGDNIDLEPPARKSTPSWPACKPPPGPDPTPSRSPSDSKPPTANAVSNSARPGPHIRQSEGPPSSTNPKEGPAMATTDKAKNTAQKAKGKVKEATGKASGNNDLRAKGKADQTKANLKQAGEKVKDAMKN